MKANREEPQTWTDCEKLGLSHFFGTELETEVAIYVRCANCPVTIRRGKVV